MPDSVYEIVVFSLAEGTDRDTWLASSSEVDSFLDAQPGFIDRTLLAPTGEGGVWVDLARWSSLAQAETAAAEFERTFGECAFVAAIEPTSMQFMHLEPAFAVVS